jgi:coenzyme F420-0:L-glutamate ligase/coenzyme F420-1:gamma-L-glutamate ligase
MQLTALLEIPPVAPGDDLAALIGDAAGRGGIALANGVLVVCQKIVSKAEGRVVALADVEASPLAREIAAEQGKDPRHIECVLRESARVVRRSRNVLICETRHGFVCANAGVDLSNAPGRDVAVLLPLDPDASARRLRDALRGTSTAPLGVIISDTFGRPWREGLVDVAIGCAGLAPIEDLRGESDWSGRRLEVTANATADQLAAAAGLLMRKDRGLPAVFVSGLTPVGDGSARQLVRAAELDLFR